MAKDRGQGKWHTVFMVIGKSSCQTQLESAAGNQSASSENLEPRKTITVEVFAHVAFWS